MKVKIPHKDFKSNIPLRDGEQVKVNHKNCPAGEDTKKRLYIKKVYGGVLAYCHHCSGVGVLFNEDGKKDLSKWLRSESRELLTSRPVTVSFEAIKRGHFDFTVESKAWLNKYDLRFEIENEIIIADHVGRPVLPIMCYEGGFCGYQIRNTVIKTPKYITNYYDNKGAGSWFRNGDSKYLYIVEDIISGLILHKRTDKNVLALLSTNLNILDEIRIRRYKCIIWLDKDEAGRKGAVKLHDRLDYLGVPNVVLNEPQPKDCSDHIIDCINEEINSYGL